MALPVSPAFVRSFGALSPELFNLPDQPSLDAFVLEAITDADAWMQVHMGTAYNLPDVPSARLQARGQAMLAMEYLTDTLKAQKVYGTHSAYISEDSPEYQALIDLNWGERAMAALDTWVTVEVGAGRAFALPLFLPTSGIDVSTDQAIDSMSEQYSEELDFARGINNPDIGTVRR